MELSGLNFTVDQDNRALVATYTPGDGEAPAGVDETWLVARLTDLGHGDWRRNTAALGVLADSIKGGRPVAALAVAEAVDAQIEVQVAPDKMLATLTVTPPQGGAPVTAEAIRRALQQQGVVTGIVEEAIAQAVAQGQAQALPVARGRPPVRGEDGHVEALITDSRNRVPQINAKGLLDYRNLGEIVTVHAGDALMRRIHATPGAAGETVTGAVIPTQPGKEAMFSPNLSGVSPAANDPDTLAAAITGQPVSTREGISVEPTYAVEAVTINSGNITFDGAVTIKGDVQAGMAIRATGDIEIGGTVEAAILEAGGDIVIKGGAIGTRGRLDAQGQEIPSHIRCGGSFTATYVQQASVDAGDSIFIDDVAMQSELCATNEIIVGHKQRGQVIGGHLQATLMVKAKVIGSAAHVATRIDIGLNPQLRAQQQGLIRQRHQAEEQLSQIIKLLELAKRQPERVPRETRERASLTLSSLEHTIARLREEETLLQEQLRLAREARVIAEHAAFEGMEVHCGALHYALTGDTEHGLEVRIGDGLLEAEPLARSKA